MRRLMLPTLLIFVMTALPGCGGGESSKPAADKTKNSGSPSAKNESNQPDAAAVYETPQAAFDAFKKATKDDDWKVAAALMSPESQSMIAAGFTIGASFMTMADEEKGKELKKLLAKHGVDLEAEPEPGDEPAGPEALTAPIKDLPAFIGEIVAWMDKQKDGADKGFPEMGELGEVSVDGESATASVSTERGPQPIEFRRVNGSWLIHLPMPKRPQAGDLPKFDPDAPTPPKSDEPEADDGTPGLGTFHIDDKPYKLRHATAYPSKFFGDPCTVVLLTSSALEERDLQDLTQSLKDDGNDGAFFPLTPHVKLSFDNESHELVSMFIWADNNSLSTSGSENFVAKFESADGKIKGAVKTSSPQDIGNSTIQLEANFDVELMTVADE